MIDINCDVGEGLDNEHLLMPYLSSCNIACGGHAGDHDSMSRVVSLAKQHQVKIGAHPSYPDRVNFGRTSMTLTHDELRDTIIDQIENLIKVTRQYGVDIHHIKPHGALYNDLVKSKSLAISFLEIISKYKSQYKLYVPFGSIIAEEAHQQGFDIVYEAFADRNYNDDLSLVSRKLPEALITNPELMISHISEMTQHHRVKTISGKLVEIRASTFCVHSDTQNAIDIVKKLHQEFH